MLLLRPPPLALAARRRPSNLARDRRSRLRPLRAKGDDADDDEAPSTSYNALEATIR